MTLDDATGCLAQANGSAAWLECPSRPDRVLLDIDWSAMDLAFDATGRRLALATYGEPDLPERPLLHVADLDSGEVAAVPLPEALHLGSRSGFADVAFAYDGTLLTGGWGGVWRWNLETGTSAPLQAGEMGRLAVVLYVDAGDAFPALQLPLYHRQASITAVGDAWK